MNFNDIPCRVTADLNAHQADLGKAENIAASLERDWKADHKADKKLEILGSIGQGNDPYDFLDFVCDHPDRDSLYLLGVFAHRPDLKPAGWGDTQEIVHETNVARILEQFAEDRLETAMEQWVEDEMDFPHFNSDPEPREDW